MKTSNSCPKILISELCCRCCTVILKGGHIFTSVTFYINPLFSLHRVQVLCPNHPNSGESFSLQGNKTTVIIIIIKPCAVSSVRHCVQLHQMTTTTTGCNNLLHATRTIIFIPAGGMNLPHPAPEHIDRSHR